MHVSYLRFLSSTNSALEITSASLFVPNLVKIRENLQLLALTTENFFVSTEFGRRTCAMNTSVGV